MLDGGCWGPEPSINPHFGAASAMIDRR